MQPVSDLFRSERKLTRKPPTAEALGVVGVGVRGDGARYTGAWREMVRRAFEVFPSRSPYSPPTSTPPARWVR